MADPTCGPSNAFKGLTRHVDQDRSVQRDRVSAGYQQPTQVSFIPHPSKFGAVVSHLLTEFSVKPFKFRINWSIWCFPPTVG